MKIRHLLLSICLCATALQAKDIDISVVDPVPVLFDDNNAFAFDLLKPLEEPEGNTLYSPFSIFSCLSMVYIGAEGKTEEAMRRALHLTISQKDLPEAYLQYFKGKTDSRLTVANAVWANQDTYFLPQFLETLQESFQAGATSLNFLQNTYAAAVINEWIDNQTHGKITHLISPESISSATRMILTNAIYFKGQWLSPFDLKRTAEGPFFIKHEESKPTLFMNQIGTFSYAETDTYQVVSLPFAREKTDTARVALLLFLPKDESNLTIDQKGVNEAIEELKSTRVSLKLPKFTLKQHFNLNDALKKLGMEIAFDKGANFSKINGSRDLFISSVMHEAYFDLDENGVTAAAATSVTMNATAAGPTLKTVNFHANHPFFFLLIDLNSKGIYFLGKYRSP